MSGETVTYLYDSLNRLASAGASSTWGESYTYDGFGNLTAKTVTAGSGPALSVAPDPNTNHLGGEDANGNAPGYVYDAENRIIQVGCQSCGGIQYAYDAQNKRNFGWTGTLDTLNNRNAYTVYYYTPGGQKLGAYQLNIVQNGPPPTLYVTHMTSDRYFGSKRLAPQDRLGSAGDFYPWGEAKGSNNPQDTWSYATYWRDSASGLDYANNRYYSNQYARFMTPDRFANSGSLTDPQSWNRYGYTRGDPVNRFDPSGADDCAAQFADASQPYDPYSSCSGYSCPGLDVTDLMDSPLAATFYAEAQAMGCTQFFQQGVEGGGVTYPQLNCQFTGPVFGSGHWATYNGVKSWVVPINLIYQATGGNGSYTFTETQNFVDIEFDNVQGAAPTVTTSSGPDLPATNLTPGSGTATYSDQPGLGIQTTANFVAFSIKTLFTYVSVSSGDGQTVNCPTVEWGNFVTLRQKNGNESGFGTDNIIQVFQ